MKDESKAGFHEVSESDHWEDMKGDKSDDICEAVKGFLNDLPGTFNHDSMIELRSLYGRLEMFIGRIEDIAEPFAEALDDEWARVNDIDARIHEGKS